MLRTSIRALALAGLPAAALLGASPASAQLDGLNALCIDMFGSNQQPRVPFETRQIVDGGARTILTTPPAVFPEGDSFGSNPPNLIPTKYEDAESCRGNPIPNTLPSTPENPYNLHDDPVVTEIDMTSPTDDLDLIMDMLEAMSAPQQICYALRGRDFCFTHNPRINPGQVRQLARAAVDIIEGNELSRQIETIRDPMDDKLVSLEGGRLSKGFEGFSERVYEGFPLLHYLGGLKTKTVDPETRNVVVNQIWHDSHIESDTNYIDPSAVQDVEWTITYNVNVLSRGHEDFAPYAMFFDDPNEMDLSDVGGPDLTQGGTVFPRIPNVGMDQTFFPMEEGQRYTFVMKMPPARFWNLTYHWGWRIHPPRVQVVENVLVPLANGMPRNSAEIAVFGANPRESEASKQAAIGMIGDYAPAKRMWKMFGDLAETRGGQLALRRLLHNHLPNIRQAFFDWQNRNLLPTGFEMAEDADMTVLFLNNTMYGEVKGHDGDAEVRIDGFWDKRGDTVKIQLLNGDYYVHAYVLVDFGGLRGWENTFHNTLPVGGAGPLFTFGRNYFWIHVAGQGPIPVPPAARPAAGPDEALAEVIDISDMAAFIRGPGQDGGPFAPGAWGGLMTPVAESRTVQGVGEHRLDVNFTYEPSRRLRMYQFDALHHDVAVWSVH